MPGRIVMDQEGAVGSQDLKKDRSQAQQAAPPVRHPAGSVLSTAHGNGLANGTNGTLPNGGLSPNNAHPTTNGESTTVSTLSSMDNPPPLDLSWRDAPSNKPLGVLMQRLASQCSYELLHNLSELAEMSTEPQHHQPNGIIPHNGQDTSHNSIKKKLTFMKWAMDQRDRFVKTLVIADWSRNIDDKSRLIDVKFWQNKQEHAHARSLQAIANIKSNMGPAKLPNPNITGAMEVMATGKASWIPDLGYVPPKRLTAKQLLNTLRNMNVILATRLNLHEDLPPHFNNFRVADGRATFVVQDEFELEISVADEDPATPFYFIDIRLSFTPAPEVINDRLRPAMESKVNAELASKGLKGCYEFLHSFALTHKLNILRGQAVELIRSNWFDCIRIEFFRRRLIIQYWATMPGPKSWIEVGISSGKQNDYRFAPPTPRLAIRWFRKAVEVKDEILEFDWRDLDVEKSLRYVISRHTAWIMNNLKNQIGALAPASSGFDAGISRPKSDSDTDLDVLSLTLPSLRQPLRIHIEPITGQFAILPSSQAAMRSEYRLNNDESADAARILAALSCATAQERVNKEVVLIGWSSIQHTTTRNGISKIMKEAVQHLSVFRPSSAWGQSWGLAVTFSLAGEKWWAVSFKEQGDSEDNVAGNVIVSASHVELPDAIGDTPAVSREMLLSIENVAVAHIGLSITGKQLKEMRIPHRLQKLPAREIGANRHERSVACNMALFVSFSELMKSQNKSKKPWADEVVRLTHHGTVHFGESGNDSAGSVRHDLRLSVERKSLKELQKHITRSKDRDLVMNSDGGLALKFLTAFGEPFVQQMQQRLQRVEKLERYLMALKKRHYNCTHVSLSRLDFTYGSAAEYGACLSFGNDGTCLRLSPIDSNPHQRIRVSLEKGMNRSDDEAFETLALYMGTTLPVLKAFDQLEAKSAAKHAISIHSRTCLWFSVKYNAPLPSLVFQLRAKTALEGRKVNGKWVIHDVQPGVKGEALAEDLVKGLNELMRDSGDHWEGIGNGISADTQGIGVALDRFDEVVRRFQGSAEPSSAKPGDAVKEAESSSAPKPDRPSTTASASSSAKPQSKPQGQANGKPAATAKMKKDTEVVVLD